MRLGDILTAGGWEASEVPTAAAVIGAESGFNTRVKNRAPCGTRKDGTPAHAVGLMQVCTIHLDPGGLLDGWSEEDLTNPVANARAGHIVFKAQGWGAWTTHTSGAYRRYPKAQDHQITASTSGGRSLSSTALGAIGAVAKTLPGIGPLVQGADLLGIPDPGDVIGGVKDAAGGVGDAASAVASVFTALTKPDTWFRIGKGYLGGILIILGTTGLVFVVAKSVVSSAPGKAAISAIPAGKAAKAIKAVT